MGAIIVPECLKQKLCWMTLITWHLTRGCFYSDMAVVHVEGLTTPWSRLGAFLPIWGRFYAWVLLLGSATALGVTFWVPTHAPNYLVTLLWGRICLPLVPCTRLPWAWPSSWVVSVPKASLGRQGYFTSQAALHWCHHYGLEATFLSSLLLFPGYPGFGAFPRRCSRHGLSYPWVSGNHTVIASL